MSGMCANCDCSDKNNCVKGNQYGINLIENADVDCQVMDAGECDSCKCGPSCACASCSCCSH
uniref:Metallothionein n=1 Tax=Silene vulgaris TaxID=42043 RepID=T1RU11_SILVU|nr:metallothionein [Silene vulgaris]